MTDRGAGARRQLGALAAKAEILKLARLLRKDPAEFEYLEGVPPAEVARLREQVTDMLFSAHGHALGRLAAASRLLPTSLIAVIAERAFGPVLAARVAGMLDPSRAVDVAAKLPTAFLADIAIDIDPRRASDVIARIPAAQIGEITGELVRRGEYVTMGRFVGHLGDDAVSAAVERMDDTALLHVAFVLEQKESLDHLVELLPDERLQGVVVAAADGEMWAEVLDLLSHLSEPLRGKLVNKAAAREDFVLDPLAAFAKQQGLWLEVLSLLPLLEPQARRRVAHAAASLDFEDSALDGLAAAVVQRDLWEEILMIAADMPDRELSLIAGRIITNGARSDAIISSLIKASERTALWDSGLRLLTVLDEPLKQQLVELVAQLDPAERDLVAERARSAGVFEQLGALGPALTSAS